LSGPSSSSTTRKPASASISAAVPPPAPVPTITNIGFQRHVMVEPRRIDHVPAGRDPCGDRIENRSARHRIIPARRAA
jgi:hypothetical protein